MSLQPPELFPQRPIRSDFGRTPSYRARRIITVLVSLLVLAWGLRLVFGGPSALRPGEIPTIRAEGSWKQRPEQPGGIDIPHQDVQVYQALDGADGTKPPVEHLLPPPETPQLAPVTAAASPPNIAPAPAPAPVSVPPVPQTENLSSPKTQTTETPAPATPPAPVPVAAAPVTPAPVDPPVNVKPMDVKPVGEAPTSPSAGSPRLAKTKPLTMAQVLKDAGSAPRTDRIVQLASVQDEASAQAMAEKMQARYASLFGSVQLHLVRVNLGAKGIYYRIQSPPVPGDQADSICATLKKLKAGCILVRP